MKFKGIRCSAIYTRVRQSSAVTYLNNNFLTSSFETCLGAKKSAPRRDTAKTATVLTYMRTKNARRKTKTLVCGIIDGP